MYKQARNDVGLSLEEASFKLHIGRRTLCKYESGETAAPADVVLGMSKLYKAPSMTQIYCREYCPIGQTYSYEVLNNVNLDPASVLLKLMGEMEEAEKVLNKLLALVVNKNQRDDFTPAEWTDFTTYVQEYLDVEHCIEVFKIILGHWCNVADLINQHNQKCITKGYIKKEKGHLVAAR